MSKVGKQFKATVWFGDDRRRTVRSFATQEELDAYMRGVDDSNGWMSYRVRDDIVTNTDLTDVRGYIRSRRRKDMR